MEADWHILFVLFLLILLPAIASRNILVTAVVLSSFLILMLPIRYGLLPWVVALTGISILLLFVSILLSIKRQVFRIEATIELKTWRIVARPLALLFIPVNQCFGHKYLLYLLGILSIIFICADLFRLFSKKNLSLFYKKNERQRFSSMTSFLVSIFIVFLLFPVEIAYLCLGFIIFGDMAAKFSGLGFGRNIIIQERTLEGSLGFLTGCIYSGTILSSVFGFKFSYLMAGAVCATLAELFSFHVDDNFTVGIITGGCLMAFQFFQVL